MTLTTIPLDAWESFFNQFSLDYQNWLTTLALDTTATNRHLMVRELPLIGIMVDRSNNERAIVLSFKDETGGNLDHTISNPQKVQYEDSPTPEGTIYLQIDAEGEERIYAYLRNQPES